MIESRSILALIPARGGSKGVPGKNIREIGGKPMIAWTIEAARRSRYIDRLIISTDDQKIIDVARAYGCEAPFVRPPELATDQADSMSVVRHAIASLPERYDFLVLLQVTSPLRTVEDIDRAIEQCQSSAAPACISICEPDKSPYWMVEMDGVKRITSLFPPDRIPNRRQDAPPVFAMNGAVYVGRMERLAAGEDFMTAGTVGYLMPKERSLDIDTELDLKIANVLLNESRRST
jgi:CMP-N,N'-diacetyllegionaminic acid synthase